MLGAAACIGFAPIVRLSIAISKRANAVVDLAQAELALRHGVRHGAFRRARTARVHAGAQVLLASIVGLVIAVAEARVTVSQDALTGNAARVTIGRAARIAGTRRAAECRLVERHALLFAGLLVAWAIAIRIRIQIVEGRARQGREHQSEKESHGR